eukprot:CAMPEP_0203872500 /NCGR_PEP_ID=MMETSP0359-20131031/19275_1 /ASSEMBLY_ACC=CAM_ASM_000338 /TAXON_ID=268821 /ORGANISM="Scrippsiella Hangoei, Strain SHTV-5" /LENGTH=263 /DNA_ID=CAMNT_0050791187 /DNA_START=49 /DNA_END=840 /DNA_ORIENTATION=+
MVRQRILCVPALALLASAIAASGVLFVSAPGGPGRRAPSVLRGAGSDLKPVSPSDPPSTSGGAPEPIWLSGLMAAAGGLISAVVFAVNLVAEGGAKLKPKPKWEAAAEVGVTEPLGFFDPLKLCKDQATFRKFRTAEIKHGRVAMMAAVGAVGQHYVKLPGFESVPSGLGALTTYPGSTAFAFLFFLAGFVEVSLWTEDPGKEPGNFGDPAGWSTTGLQEVSYGGDMRGKEINNGRVAMFAAIGIIAAELATGKDGVEQMGLR